MLKSRNTPRDATSEMVPRRRFRRMVAAVGKYKRIAAVSTTLLVVISIALLGFVLADEPETVKLGVGKAGVMDTQAASDTLDAAALPASPQAAQKSSGSPGEDVASELPEGDASYYGNELAGRPTASGESFNPETLTAAHRTLPFGTRLRVTNTSNGKSVTVRVNDRGPFSGKRVLDLSHSAARQIGMLQRGTARVRMQVLK